MILETRVDRLREMVTECYDREDAILDIHCAYTITGAESSNPEVDVEYPHCQVCITPDGDPAPYPCNTVKILRGER